MRSPYKYRSALINFVHSALKDQKLTVHEGAERAWCYVSVFIRGVFLVMKHPLSGKYEAFNTGSDEYHTMQEVARMVIEECAADYSQIKVVKPPSKFLSLGKRFSIDKAESIGYKSEVSLREGIHRIVDWQKKETLA